MEVVGCLIGHSFVSGLHQHLSGRLHHYATPRDCAKELKISNLVKDLHLIGMRGATIVNNPMLIPKNELLVTKPDFVIINCGTNDMAKGIPPLNVAMELFETAQKLLLESEIKHVILCSAIYRSKGLHFHSETEFCSVVDIFNQVLSDMCGEEKHITYHTHRGFWRTETGTSLPTNVWSNDGIHPNTVVGRKKYKRSIRDAVFNVLKYLN
jgi:hypothetical protein